MSEVLQPHAERAPLAVAAAQSFAEAIRATPEELAADRALILRALDEARDASRAA